MWLFWSGGVGEKLDAHCLENSARAWSSRLSDDWRHKPSTINRALSSRVGGYDKVTVSNASPISALCIGAGSLCEVHGHFDGHQPPGLCSDRATPQRAFNSAHEYEDQILKRRGI